MSTRRNLKADDPPNSRLFIIGPKTLEEQDLRKAFSEFGDIEEIWMVKDKNTGETKGITYIKFSKTSEAAKALESLNGKTMFNGRNIKVKVAASRDQGATRDANEDDRIKRLFVMIPKTMTDAELHTYFEQFGDIEYASVIKDRNTRESKGFAYVKYTKFSHAALAFEKCDKKYKAVFAEPRKPKEELNKQQPIQLASFPQNRNGNFMSQPPDHYHNDGFTKLTVIANPMVTEDQMWKLLDIIPTMDFCQTEYDGNRSGPSRAITEVAYASPQWASYAKEKFHGFEYPPGSRLIVRPDYGNAKINNVRHDEVRSGGYNKRRSSPLPAETATKSDILKIAETLAQATSLIQAAGLSPDILQGKFGMLSESKDEMYCNVKLPPAQPLVDIDSKTEARCFIVCSPSPLPNSVLKDIFSRFGNLIDCYMLNKKTCGYAKYATRESAEDAIKTLHGAEVLGIRLKVLEAEERPEKRQKMDVDSDSPF